VWQNVQALGIDQNLSVPKKGLAVIHKPTPEYKVFFSGIRFNAPRHASRARNYGCKVWVQEARDVYAPSHIVAAMHGKVDACSPSRFNSLGPFAIASFLRREPTPIPGQTIRHREHAWLSISHLFALSSFANPVPPRSLTSAQLTTARRENKKNREKLV